MSSEKKQVNASPDSQSVALRNALGSFATGITVVTALGVNEQKIGMTVNSFNSVSLNPALVLWSIDKKSKCFNDFIKAKSYAIHVLSHEQQAISDQFALSGEDKFSNLQCTSGLNNVPILPDFSACFECSVEHHYEGGDHVILVGKVIKFEDRGSQPLVFYRGNYTSF